MTGSGDQIAVLASAEEMAVEESWREKLPSEKARQQPWYRLANPDIYFELNMSFCSPERLRLTGS